MLCVRVLLQLAATQNAASRRRCLRGRGFRAARVRGAGGGMGCWPLATLACTLATGHRTPRGGSDEGVLMRMYYLYLISYDILYLIFKFSRGDFGGHRPESHRAHSVDTERALISSVLVFRGTRRRAFFLSMNKFLLNFYTLYALLRGAFGSHSDSGFRS